MARRSRGDHAARSAGAHANGAGSATDQSASPQAASIRWTARAVEAARTSRPRGRGVAGQGQRSPGRTWIGALRPDALERPADGGQAWLSEVLVAFAQGHVDSFGRAPATRAAASPGSVLETVRFLSSEQP